MDTKIIGTAKRMKVDMPLGAQRDAWDCRRFGFGRIVTPKLPVRIELEPGMLLDVSTGALLSSVTGESTGDIRSRRLSRRLAA